MLQTYRDGGDIHAQTTSVIYGIPFEQAIDKNAEHYKERWTIVKNCNFGVFFGLFPRGLQKTLKFKAGLDTPLSDRERIIAIQKYINMFAATAFFIFTVPVDKLIYRYIEHCMPTPFIHHTVDGVTPERVANSFGVIPLFSHISLKCSTTASLTCILSPQRFRKS